jgi:hypothetical protein
MLADNLREELFKEVPAFVFASCLEPPCGILVFTFRWVRSKAFFLAVMLSFLTEKRRDFLNPTQASCKIPEFWDVGSLNILLKPFQRHLPAGLIQVA